MTRIAKKVYLKDNCFSSDKFYQKFDYLNIVAYLHREGEPGGGRSIPPPFPPP